jgi:hypothetical protein
MNINFSTYASMLAWPNPNDGDMGIIDLINKTYTYNAVAEKWLCPDQDKNVNVTKSAADGATEWAPTIDVNEYTTLNNISSSMTSLIISMGALPDSYYSYEYKFRFTTPATLGLTTFSVLDSSGVAVTWLGSAPALVGGKTYEISVVGNLAIIGASV